MNYSGQKIIYVSRYSTMDGPFVEFMNYLGVTSDKLVRIEKPSSFRNIIIPEYCTKSEQFYHPLYIEIFNRVVENSRYNEVNTYQNRKIYFSRSKFIGAKQKDFGENYIQPVFEKNGYVKTYPETLSLKEQISLWNTASKIACINGTIPLNTAFCRNRKLMVIVLNKTPIEHSNIFNLQKIFDLKNIVYVDCFYEKYKNESKSLGDGPFFIHNSVAFQGFCKDYGLNNIKFSSAVYNLKSYFFLMRYKYFNYYKYFNKLMKLKKKIIN